MNNKFGGVWTIIKLDVLRKYLEAYTTAFKKLKYELIYLDAFAGTGEFDTRVGVIEGSTKIALDLPRFNQYIFIEQDLNKYLALNQLKKDYPHKKISIVNGDCNDEIIHIVNNYNWKYTRALAFLDPYNMELSFNTLEILAKTGAFDVWYLFPLNSATRSLRNDGDIDEPTEERLNRLFGDNDWKEKLYYENPQMNFLNNENNLIRKDQKDICCYFKNKMETVFPSVSCPICLKNSNKAPLFLLYFAVSNKDNKAQRLANNIANHIINKKQTFVCGTPQKMI
ncbi:MAG: three-Cys-motif partner protein TcmP [Tissierellia bacterium]|nr:three-Cys-motif partner protein TcmP [Tissierellia bacterium]